MIWWAALQEDLDKRELMIISKKNYERMIRCLEYIEMSGSEYEHDDKDARCQCGQCMGNEARKALEG